MYSLDRSNRKVSITLKDMYQDQWMLIRLMKKYRSRINKGINLQWTWRRFYFHKNGWFVSTSISTQPEHLSRPLPRLPGKQIHMSNLNMDYGRFSITPKDKPQDQWTIILRTKTDKVTNNNDNIETKTPKKVLLCKLKRKIKSQTTFKTKPCISISWLLK